MPDFGADEFLGESGDGGEERAVEDQSPQSNHGKRPGNQARAATR